MAQDLPTLCSSLRLDSGRNWFTTAMLSVIDDCYWGAQTLRVCLARGVPVPWPREALWHYTVRVVHFSLVLAPLRVGEPEPHGCEIRMLVSGENIDVELGFCELPLGCNTLMGSHGEYTMSDDHYGRRRVRQVEGRYEQPVERFNEVVPNWMEALLPADVVGRVRAGVANQEDRARMRFAQQAHNRAHAGLRHHRPPAPAPLVPEPQPEEPVPVAPPLPPDHPDFDDPRYGPYLPDLARVTVYATVTPPRASYLFLGLATGALAAAWFAPRGSRLWYVCSGLAAILTTLALVHTYLTRRRPWLGDANDPYTGDLWNPIPWDHFSLNVKHPLSRHTHYRMVLACDQITRELLDAFDGQRPTAQRFRGLVNHVLTSSRYRRVPRVVKVNTVHYVANQLEITHGLAAAVGITDVTIATA